MKKIVKESLFELKSLAQPQIYQNYAFCLETSFNEKADSYDTNIVGINVNTKQKTYFGTNANHLQLNVDKQAGVLYFLSNSIDQKYQIFKMNIFGGKAEVLTTEENGVSSYYLKDNVIYYQTFTKAQKEEKLEPTVIKKVMYKNDGAGLIDFTLQYQLKSISNGTTELLYESNEAFQLNYVTNNQTKVILAKWSNADHWDYARSIVYQLDLKSKTIESLTNEGSYRFAVSNNDESKYYFIGNSFELKFVSQNKLYEYDVESKTLNCLTQDLDQEISDVFVADLQQQTQGFKPFIDQNELYFATTSYGKSIVHKINLTSLDITEVMNEYLHITDNDEYLITYSTLAKPSVLATFTNNEIVEIYNPNAEFENTHLFPHIERITYSGYNDLAIQGWFVHPIEQQEHLDIILYIHGGPQVCFGESFFHEMQVYASHGYGVLMLNPRGGNGYGQEFVAAILGAYGRHDYDDLMLGVDYIQSKYPNIKDVYLTGGSYGGFMTNWIVGQTTRFKRAVTQRSISNWISFYGTSDIGPFFVENQLLCDLSQSDLLWQMSPLAYVQNVKTPLLILHGEEDLRCPLEQAQQFYTGLKKHQVETQLITYPKSSHSLSRTGILSLRMHRIQAILDWFAKK